MKTELYIECKQQKTEMLYGLIKTKGQRTFEQEWHREIWNKVNSKLSNISNRPATF